MFYDNFYDLIRVVVVGIGAYGSLILLLRISGKRTLTKMNAFDLVVTVALGSTLATILLSNDVALAEGITAFVVLITLQFMVAWLSVRSAAVRQLVKATPKLLFYQGQFNHEALIWERVTQEEVFAAIRAQGIADLEQVEAVVLETDGSITTLKRAGEVDTSTLKYVAGDGKSRRPVSNE